MQETKAIVKNKELIHKSFDLAYDYESKYGACSQCVVLAVMETLGEVNQDVFKSAFGFGGGIGNLSHTCGALLGGVMMISLEYGRDLKKPRGSN
jgi:hypothetical protein